ncbi:MAG: poly-gamma-glutamate biosynthesis protein PgsC [Planctomycetota bacterium]
MDTTIAIGLGLIVSLVFTEAFGLSVGGMIVPGYLALHLQSPATIIATLAAAMFTVACVRLISQHAIVFGRRRIVLTMLIGFLVGELIRQSISLTTMEMHPSISVIGFVIPGLIALWIDRTSILQTLSPLTAATGMVHLALVVAGVTIR